MFRVLDEFYEWFHRRRLNNAYEVSRTPLEAMDGWQVDPGTGNIGHRSGKFFSVQGLDIRTDHRETAAWSQPIIVQPEIGILGIVVKVVDGEVHCLLQAKMEPGNVNLLQLSPTVQATRSNYTRVHRGSAVPYLEHFTEPRDGRAVVDVLQSEQGSWFLNKRNRNMIVEVTGDLPVGEDFCWLSLGQVAELLREDNLVNMDARTVLSGMPFFSAGGGVGLGGPEPGRDEQALHPVAGLLSWFTECKARYQLSRRTVPLAELPRWSLTGGEIRHDEQRHFSVVGVDVRATNREVASWSQPMLKPVDRGVIGFLGRRINGAFHVLVQARTEAGTHDVVEMAPTVSCIPANSDGMPPQFRPRFLDELVGEPNTIVDVVHSEEGGRFFHAENRYLVVDVGEDFDLDVPADYCWMTPEQLTGFVRYGNYVNVAARCLLTCLLGESTRLVAGARR
ncbi:NDP-hexose 2,3-dehydratase family protein [Saccharopolyspora indica]|uniref:NDP-hexose 2,3-dehydratase family protein n=1 Tax=Saccharopolyspora indica TaxID=1229659 RepID=UPI0022EB75E2|nr:NDP-hexose 2,3-dehydratase family protein [Saccharopolyspora indica]MDA3645746.1 NDP-hexose 2,3-dehydratase family protein [Saccharopolyspora indica]